MRAVGTLLVVCIALAVVKAALALLLVVMVIAMIWAICMHPREMLGALVCLATVGLINAQPALALSFIAVTIIAGQLSDQKGEAPSRRLRHALSVRHRRRFREK